MDFNDEILKFKLSEFYSLLSTNFDNSNFDKIKSEFINFNSYVKNPDNKKYRHYLTHKDSKLFELSFPIVYGINNIDLLKFFENDKIWEYLHIICLITEQLSANDKKFVDKLQQTLTYNSYKNSCNHQNSDNQNSNNFQKNIFDSLTPEKLNQAVKNIDPTMVTNIARLVSNSISNNDLKTELNKLKSDDIGNMINSLDFTKPVSQEVEDTILKIINETINDIESENIVINDIVNIKDLVGFISSKISQTNISCNIDEIILCMLKLFREGKIDTSKVSHKLDISKLVNMSSIMSLLSSSSVSGLLGVLSGGAGGAGGSGKDLNAGLLGMLSGLGGGENKIDIQGLLGPGLSNFDFSGMLGSFMKK